MILSFRGEDLIKTLLLHRAAVHALWCCSTQSLCTMQASHEISERCTPLGSRAVVPCGSVVAAFSALFPYVSAQLPSSPASALSMLCSGVLRHLPTIILMRGLW